jgi:hypothetical protein
LEVPVVALHPWHRERVLLRRELLVVVVVEDRARKMAIRDNLFIRLLEVDVPQFVYKTQLKI